MYSFKKVNDIAGWVIFGLSSLVYILTVEETASFWDCGEFIAVAFKLEVPHPPGAPLFLLIGRMFSFLSLGDVTQVAFWINISSCLASGFTIMFLYWTITLLAAKLLKTRPEILTKDQAMIVVASGAIGAMAYAFSDSFWFSAVEAEVYALSSFFTAFVFWAILKWDLIEDEAAANRWLILIAYMIGLSIGVHLLNLVTLPALGLVWYFKKYQEPKRWGLLATLAVSGVILLVIMIGIIPGLPSLAFNFELFFVNGLGLPFSSGIIFFSLLFLGALVYGVWYSEKKKKANLNVALLSLAFILVGYASYSIVVIRSNYNPPIDQNNPENINSFVSYLKREQYGDRPLLYGHYFTAETISQTKGAPVYTKGKEKYEIADYKVNYEYDPKHMTFFPRMYAKSPTGRNEEKYREVTGLREGQKPNFGHNIQFMLKHQMGHMYWRYFMWNFAGRAGDVQDSGWLAPWDAFEKDLPHEVRTNKARNNFFMLPLILGLIGLFFHYRMDKKYFWVVALLFFLTGLALILYLNSGPIEPRERDYIYVGSFYAFAIWIGLGTLSLYEGFRRLLKNHQPSLVAAAVISLSVPVIMAAQGWDDHDRSNRYLSVDAARNYLESCAPNAILFTGGDNDTFPLWYAQEVEGIRTDVRVIVLSYFNTDWYVEQMTRKINESEPLPFTLDKSHYRQGGLNDYLPYVENPNIKGAINLKQYMKLIRDNYAALQVPTSISSYNSIPSRSVYLDVDSAQIERLGFVPEYLKRYQVNRMTWGLKGRGLEKKDLMLMDFILANNWERPIYFNNTSLAGINIDLRKFVVQEGLTYRLMPIENPNPSEFLVNREVMYENVMNKFWLRELDNPKVYYNEDYRNFVLNHRSTFGALSEALLNAGEEEKSREVILSCLSKMTDEAVRFDHYNLQFVSQLLNLNEEDKAIEMAETLGTRADEMLVYMDRKNIKNMMEIQRNLIILNELSSAFKQYGDDDRAARFEELFSRHYSKLRG